MDAHKFLHSTLILGGGIRIRRSALLIFCWERGVYPHVCHTIQLVLGHVIKTMPGTWDLTPPLMEGCHVDDGLTLHWKRLCHRWLSLFHVWPKVGSAEAHWGPIGPTLCPSHMIFPTLHLLRPKIKRGQVQRKKNLWIFSF